MIATLKICSPVFTENYPNSQPIGVLYRFQSIFSFSLSTVGFFVLSVDNLLVYNHIIFGLSTPYWTLSSFTLLSLSLFSLPISSPSPLFPSHPLLLNPPPLSLSREVGSVQLLNSNLKFKLASTIPTLHYNYQLPSINHLNLKYH